MWGLFMSGEEWWNTLRLPVKQTVNSAGWRKEREK